MKVVLLLIATMAVSYSSACSCSDAFDPVCATNGETYHNDCYLFCDDNWVERLRCGGLEEPCKENPGGLLCNSGLQCDFPQIQCRGPCPCVKPDKTAPES